VQPARDGDRRRHHAGADRRREADAPFQPPGVGAACGLVLPRRIKTLWERGRFIEYCFAFTFYKQVQDYYAGR